jgi:hypothetical protein
MMFASITEAQSLDHRKMVGAPEETRIKDQYIVVFNDDVEDVATKMKDILDLRSRSNKLRNIFKDGTPDSETFSFDNGLKGISISNLPSDVLEQLLNDKDVKRIEEVRKSDAPFS